MSISQKDAVVQAVKAQLGSRYVEGADCSKLLTKVDRQNISITLANGILNGNVAYSKTLDAAEVRGYVSGLLSNHLRKAKELNGGCSAPKSTTPRVPKTAKVPKSTDARLFALNKLITMLKPGTTQYDDTQRMINECTPKA